MSLAPYTFRPLTPPDTQDTAGQRPKHMRSVSASVCSFNKNVAPDASTLTPRTSPVYRQTGPTLLPKIRTQDNNLRAAANHASKAHKRSASNVSNVSTYNNVRPPIFRCATEPVQDNPTLMSPISNASYSRSSSVAPFMSASRCHSRAVSSCSVDESMLGRYGYPTYRQTPIYMTQQMVPSPSVYAQTYFAPQQYPCFEPPAITLDDTFDLSFELEQVSRPTSLSPPPSLQPSLLLQEPVSFSLPAEPILSLATTSLMTYLTQPTQPINLVRQLTYSAGRGLSSFFWWDVRNIRPWSTFALETFEAIPDLMTLANFQHDNSTFPSLAAQSTSAATPTSEADLASLISKIYFPRVNAAAQLSLGPSAPYFYLAPQTPAPVAVTAATVQQAQPSFLLNYPSENQFTLNGTPRGRVVGLARSFDTFNSSMRHESPGQRVKYLRTLSQLQKCMRDHSCRYGFIITEIELICVRAGSDKYGHPYFGHLEIADAIATKTSATYGVDADGNYNEDVSMTASLALYFVLMLAKKIALPGQWGSFMDVGCLGAMTRSRVLPANVQIEADAATTVEDGALASGLEERKADGRDKWMPDPQVGEKRDAKTARGWVWPSDPWHKREGGRRSRRG